MATLAQAKTLGGVGSILVLLTIIPGFGFILGIVGFILVLIAVKYVSDAVQDPSIFKNMMIAVVMAILGVVIFVGVVRAVIPGLINITDPTTLPDIGEALALEAIETFLAALALLWIFYLVAAVFLRKSYVSIANRLGVNIFATTGLLFLIGAVTIIILVGLIILLIAYILQIVAFFSIPDQPPGPAPAEAVLPPSPPAQEAEPPPPGG